MSFDEALAKATSVAETYTSVHVWVFTSTTFRGILEALRESGHVEWQIEAFEDVKPGQNEMRMVLRHHDARAGDSPS
jgi:hypothetical protein